jgi:hypothetical protein
MMRLMASYDALRAGDGPIAGALGRKAPAQPGEADTATINGATMVASARRIFVPRDKGLLDIRFVRVMRSSSSFDPRELSSRRQSCEASIDAVGALALNEQHAVAAWPHICPSSTDVVNDVS